MKGSKQQAGSGRAEPASAASSNTFDNDYMAYLALIMLGKTVSVKTTDKSEYEGLFQSYKLDGQDPGITLQHARTLVKSGKPIEDRTRAPFLTIDLKHLDTFSATEVNLEASDIAATAVRDASEFTDASICGAAASSSKARDLQAFVFDESATAGVAEWDGATTGWSGEDMFRQNEKFGVTDTFKMEEYTTALDPAAGGISDAKAAQIEAEILANKTNNRHTAEERGLADDSGISEEDRYGAVLRAPPAAGSSTVPAAPPGVAAPPGAALPRGAWGARAAAASSSRAAEVRTGFNDMRRTLEEGKNLSNTVGPEKQQRYTNDVKTVDALNLNPGTGSKQFRKAANAEVATQLSDFKSKLHDGGAASGPPAPASTPAPPLPVVKEDAASGSRSRAPSSVAESLAPSKEGLKSFKFNLTAKAFTPKVASPKGAASPKGGPRGERGSANPHAKGERGGGRGQRGRNERGGGYGSQYPVRPPAVPKEGMGYHPSGHGVQQIPHYGAPSGYNMQHGMVPPGPHAYPGGFGMQFQGPHMGIQQMGMQHMMHNAPQPFMPFALRPNGFVPGQGPGGPAPGPGQGLGPGAGPGPGAPSV